ncbi:IDO-domain-containing protein [Clavulina sp. PMI_390]|nr:IDO-domain-containing protein [Clavulina sp. PMI_390]
MVASAQSLLRSLGSAASSFLAYAQASCAGLPSTSTSTISTSEQASCWLGLKHAFNSQLDNSILSSVNPQQQQAVDLAEYDANASTGFMPGTIGARLPAHYDAWERALDLVNCGHESVLSLGEDTSADALSKRASSEAWRQSIRDMPVLSTDILSRNIQHQRRAHHVLAFLAHFYIHSLPPSEPPVIPAPIAVPLCITSAQLGVTPILTYADTVNWNIVARDPSKPLAPGNLRSLTSFTGTDDEDAFYQCCANVELYGTPALSNMVDYENLVYNELHAPSSSSTPFGFGRIKSEESLRTIAASVASIGAMVVDLTDLLRGCHGACSPRVFYDQIRPWFRGSSSGHTPWVYEGVSDTPSSSLHYLFASGEWTNLSGPSGGQSALMHAFDLFLDVDHAMERNADESSLRTPVEAREGNDRLFMQRMQKYIPGPHRAFLNHLSSNTHNVRNFAVSLSQSTSSTPAFTAAAQDVIKQYNNAVCALRRFRDAHLKIACVYVVAQAKKAAQLKEVEAQENAQEQSQAAKAKAAGCPVAAMLARLEAEGDADLLAATGRCPVSGVSLAPPIAPVIPVVRNLGCAGPALKEPIRGTGGSELVTLLRSGRDATTRAMIPLSSPSPSFVRAH